MVLPILLIGIALIIPAIQRNHVPAGRLIPEQQKLKKHLVSGFNDSFHGLLYAQDDQRLHFAFYHKGGFVATTGAGSANAIEGVWDDVGSITLANGRTFGYRRESVTENSLEINGVSYELGKGTVFLLQDDGTVRQLPVTPGRVTPQNYLEWIEKNIPSEKTAAAQPNSEVPAGKWCNSYVERPHFFFGALTGSATAPGSGGAGGSLVSSAMRCSLMT